MKQLNIPSKYIFKRNKNIKKEGKEACAKFLQKCVQKSNELTRNTLANKLIHKQQRPDQSQYGMLEAFMTNSF